MMAQLQVRQTIQLLARILRENGATEISAETFRLAKFNKDEATHSFWILLFELLYFVKYNTMDEIPIKAVQDLSSEEIVVYVKRELNKYGFTCNELNTLPNDMSTGSRELLLATGWLLCKEAIIDKYMQRRGVDIGEDTACFHPLDDSGDKNTLKLLNNFKDPSDKVKYLLWLNGKLHMKMKQLHALQMEKSKYVHEIHKATSGVSLTPDKNHLSTLEVYLLRHPDALKKMVKLLDDDNQRLQNLLTWKEKQDSFWKWMESVLDLKLREKELDAESVEIISSSSVDNMSSSYVRLQKCINQYENQLEDLERCVLEKTSDIKQSVLDKLIQSIESEIKFHEEALSSAVKTRPQSSRLPPKQPILAFINETKPDSRPGAAFRKEIESVERLESQVDMLQNKVVDLEQMLTKRQNHFKEELTKVSDQFRDSFVVPPLGRREMSFDSS